MASLKDHDFSKPFTKEEIEELKQVFYSLPTYNKEGNYILASDVGTWYKRIGYPRTEEQIKYCEEYWKKHYEGKISLPLYINCCEGFHDSYVMLKDRVKAYDKDCDGFISYDEMKDFMEIAVIHEPKLQISQESFLKEADTNKDGKVSIDEFAAWVAKVCAEN